MARKSLKPLRAYIKGLITKANKKIELLKEQGLYDSSFAVSLAQQKQSRAANVDYGDQLFSITGMKSRKELNREKGRLLAFLSDTTSNPAGAKVESKALMANEKWGGAFFAKGVKNHIDADRARADYLSIAAEAYRRLSEDYPNLLGGKKGFESGTMINMLYDQVSNLSGTGNPFTIDRDWFVDVVHNYGKGIMNMFQRNLIRSNFATEDYDTTGLKKKRKVKRK